MIQIDPFWNPDPAILAADLAEFEALSMRDADAFRRLYLNEFFPAEPIEVTPAQYHELASAKSYAFGDERRTFRTCRRTGERTMYIGERPVVVVHAAGGGGSDDGGSDDDRTPPAVRYRPAHGGRLPSPVSVH